MENMAAGQNRTFRAGDADHQVEPSVRPKEQWRSGCILVVTNQSHPTLSVMEYVISLADRLGSKIIMVSVNTRPLLASDVFSAAKRRKTSAPETDIFRNQAQERGIEFECIREEGKISKVVKRLCHIVKRVEFVVIDQGIEMEEVAAGSPVPVFSVCSSTREPAWKARGRQIRTLFHGESSMKTATRRTYLAKTLIFGAVTAALYAAVFAYSEQIMHYWTKGGIYCLLPVATVFVFSYAHGSFTGNFWSALGIEGSKASSSKQKQTQVTTSETAQKRPDTRPRMQVNA